jgi:hypothetical protein
MMIRFYGQQSKKEELSSCHARRLASCRVASCRASCRLAVLFLHSVIPSHRRTSFVRLAFGLESKAQAQPTPRRPQHCFLPSTLFCMQKSRAVTTFCLGSSVLPFGLNECNTPPIVCKSACGVDRVRRKFWVGEKFFFFLFVFELLFFFL